MAQANSGTFATPEGQLSFCDSLFEKRSMDGVKFNYGCTIIFDDKHRAFFMDIIRRVIGQKWGDKGQRDFDKGLIKSPILEGDGPQAHSKQSGELWGGMGKGILNAYTYENPSGGRGVSFGIRAFQKFRDGEPLGGRQPFDPDKWIVDIEDDKPADVDVFG